MMKYTTITILFCLLVLTFEILPSNLTSFSVLASTTVTSAGTTVVYGNVGLYPGSSATGFPPGILTGTNAIFTSINATSQNAQQNLIPLYSQISLLPCINNFSGFDLSNKVLAPGVYCFSSSAGLLTGTLTFDSQGLANPFWFFQISTTLTTGGSTIMQFINGSNPCNVFWNIGSSLTLGASSNFIGVVNAYTSISLGTAATVTGKLFAQNGAVTLLSNTLNNCTENNALVSCFGLQSSNPLVCSGQGICIASNYCGCGAGYSGSQCASFTFTCFGLAPGTPTVCNGHGTCTGPNTCVCNTRYSGTQCQTFTSSTSLMNFSIIILALIFTLLVY